MERTRTDTARTCKEKPRRLHQTDERVPMKCTYDGLLIAIKQPYGNGEAFVCAVVSHDLHAVRQVLSLGSH